MIERPDLDAYFERISYQGQCTPSAATLAALQLAHATHIPFENIDVLLGKPIQLDLESLQTKLVVARRGGYCFEQNTLFAAVLEALGFPVTLLLARVRYRTSTVLPRTHLVLRVEVEGASWIADVGFGGEGLVQPLPLRADQVYQHGAWQYRLTQEGSLWVLQSMSNGHWKDLYAFSEEPQYAVDVEVANHYTSTHPETRFKKLLTVQLPQLAQRTFLRNNELLTETATETTSRTLTDDEVRQVLSEIFGIQLTPETHLIVPPPQTH